MPGYFLREFDCTRCGQPFNMMEGDMILPIPRLCDECLKKLWDLGDTALDALETSEGLKYFMNDLRLKWESLEALLEDRTRARRG